MTMNPVNEFNEIDWLNNYLGQASIINSSEIQSILNFSFIWNLFEGLACKSHADINTFINVIGDLSRSGKLTIGTYSGNLAYFKDRYLTLTETNDLFEGLKFRPNDNKKLVADVLKGVIVEDKSVLLALVIIVYRLRNNLFHGVKSLYSMSNQVDNFRNANQILIKFLEEYNIP